MARLEEYLATLKKLRTDLAHERLTKPEGRSAFEFGKAVGEYQGLLRAEEALLNIDKEQKNRERQDDEKKVAGAEPGGFASERRERGV